MMRRRFMAGAALGVALFAVPAGADSAPKADVLVIHATNCPNPSVDPAIGEKPSLGYSCYKVIDRRTLSLAQGQGTTMGMPNGRTLQLTYNGIVPGSSPERHKINVAISKPDGAGYLTLADVNAELGKKFNVGGWNFQGGTIINQITVHR